MKGKKTGRELTITGIREKQSVHLRIKKKTANHQENVRKFEESTYTRCIQKCNDLSLFT